MVETAKGAGNDGGGERTPMTLNGSDAEFPEDMKAMTFPHALQTPTGEAL